MVAGFLGFGGTSHRSMDMDRFCSRPSCFVSCALRASKVIPPAAPLLLLVLVTTVASWKSARVSSSTSPSSNFIPFSSIQARITCCSSFSWIKPSPVSKRKKLRLRRLQRAAVHILIVCEIPLIFHGSRPENCGVNSESFNSLLSMNLCKIYWKSVIFWRNSNFYGLLHWDAFSSVHGHRVSPCHHSCLAFSPIFVAAPKSRKQSIKLCAISVLWRESVVYCILRICFDNAFPFSLFTLRFLRGGQIHKIRSSLKYPPSSLLVLKWWLRYLCCCCESWKRGGKPRLPSGFQISFHIKCGKLLKLASHPNGNTQGAAIILLIFHLFP